MLKWNINLIGYGEQETGDVVTRDGEVIGTWSLDENGHCLFTPDGEAEAVLLGTMLPFVVDRIAKWHAQREVRQMAQRESPQRS